jgi:hypothetical protein
MGDRRISVPTKFAFGSGLVAESIKMTVIAFPIGDSVAPGHVDADTLFRLGLAYDPGLMVPGLLCSALR